MLSLLLIGSMLFTISMASTDPVVSMCSNRCSAFDDLQEQCANDKGCWELNGGVYDSTTAKCLAQCWPISQGCYGACYDAYHTCDAQCPDDSTHPDCFFTCYDVEFEKLKPQLPTVNKSV